MTHSQFQAWLSDPKRPTLVMGILNVTPDSFSDGGQFAEAGAAVEHGLRLIDEGADVLDVGGESTRPGAQRIPHDEQLRRILPVIRELAKNSRAVISVDTTRAAVARAAIGAGATLVNDISAGTDDPEILPLAAQMRSAIILMHMRGQPATMQQAPIYRNVVQGVGDYLADRAAAARASGIAQGSILLDPGIGFGKNSSHNLELLRNLPELTKLGHPLVVGTSRKAFIGQITGEKETSQRIMGTAATVAWCAANGAAMVRVHDAGAMARVVRMIRAIRLGIDNV